MKMPLAFMCLWITFTCFD